MSDKFKKSYKDIEEPKGDWGETPYRQKSMLQFLLDWFAKAWEKEKVDE
jgi:hypothetical protein